jgi:predicted N-acetyltransferase YhbS
MNYQQYTIQQLEEIKQLFTKTFGDSEGEAEGKMIGELAVDLIQTTPEQDIKVFVAIDEGHVVGSILFTRLTFESEKTAFLLAPVAVHTSYQGKGVGQALINHGLEAMKAVGTELAFTYGDPSYYGRVGFESVSVEQYPSPQPLSMPIGWLAQSLTEEPLMSLSGGSQCVEAFNKPELW